MLTLAEKNKVKDVLAEGLNIRRDINLAFFLDSINNTNQKVNEMNSKINQILSNQRYLDQKLDIIVSRLNMLG